MVPIPIEVTPFILGSGRAARAIREAWAILSIARSDEVRVHEAVNLSRHQPLEELNLNAATFPVLCVANPSGLHAETLLRADRLGFRAIIVEKPAAVTLDQIARIKKAKIQTPVAICHVYRQMWGIQKLKRLIESGEFGQILAIEGRYWQSSAAQRALQSCPITQVDISDDGTVPHPAGWKNDPALRGPFDALTDIAVHWVDTAAFLMPEKLKHARLWLSYANAESPGRDSHIQLQLAFSGGAKALASVSKTVHGAGNHFEINVIGTGRYACWKFLDPDVIEVGMGNRRVIENRSDDELASRHPAHHGLGWVDGYVNIFRDTVLSLVGKSTQIFPMLADHLLVLEILLNAETERSHERWPVHP